jgi:hypothetical protein
VCGSGVSFRYRFSEDLFIVAALVAFIVERRGRCAQLPAIVSVLLGGNNFTLNIHCED